MCFKIHLALWYSQFDGYHELGIFKESSNADNNDSCDVGEYFIGEKLYPFRTFPKINTFAKK